VEFKAGFSTIQLVCLFEDDLVQNDKTEKMEIKSKLLASNSSEKEE